MIDHLTSLAIEQKVGQLFFIGIPGPEIDDSARSLLREVSPGGICLFARNIKDAAQTRELLDNARSLSPVVPFLGIDQEGGLVDRLRRILPAMPAAGKIKSTDDAARLATIIAESLLILGFNMDFAPVVDVIDDARGQYSNGLFSRNFGASKEESALLAGHFLQTLQSSGIIGCLKHFPGLGASRVDSHEELPSLELTDLELFEEDLFPYRKLLPAGNVSVVMVAHACYPTHSLQETDQNGKLLPSSLSYNFITNLLRGELGFGGVVVSDDLEMGAIVKNYGIGDACKRAILAGVDMLAICADQIAIREGYFAVLDAVRNGEIEVNRIDESLVRIGRLKADLSGPHAFSTDRLKGISKEIVVLNEQINS